MINLFNKTITLFNRYENAEYTDTYYKTVLTGVCLQSSIVSDNNTTDSSCKSSVKIFVDYIKLPKPYLSPKGWLASTDKSNNITFKTDDYVYIGSYSSTLTNISSLYDSNDNVFKISSVSFYDVLNSFQLVAN